MSCQPKFYLSLLNTKNLKLLFIKPYVSKYNFIDKNIYSCFTVKILVKFIKNFVRKSEKCIYCMHF